jgi:hypothetical protein
MVGSGLSAADLCVFDIVDLHVRIFPEQMAKDVRGCGAGLGCWGLSGLHRSW